MLGLAVALTSHAQQTQAKIGYVDFERVANNSPQIALGRARLEDEFQSQNVSIEEDEQRLAEMEDRLIRESDIMTEEQVESLELRARSLRRQVQRDREDLADEINFRVNEVQKEVEAEIGDIVRQFAENNGYDLILVTRILYVSDTVDITDDVIEILQQQALEAGGTDDP
ncbi:MAG: OmpH family outer membrane protein [Pseudomonadota bacterium]